MGRAKGPLGVLLAVVLLVVVAVGAFWAGRVTLQADDAESSTPREPAEVTVVEQTLGRVITLTTTVRRPSVPLARNNLAGVVTWVSSPDTEDYASGDELYRVGDTPVVVVEGDTPFWRDLADGDRGADVLQVERFLALKGASLEPDEVWDEATTRAVQAWQAEQGVAQTGSFALGTLLATATSPVALALDRDLARPGEVLSGGEAVVTVADGDPTFVMEVTEDQAALVPMGTTVSVQGDDMEWPGVVSEASTTEEGLTALVLTAPDGGLVCGQDCAAIPSTGDTYLMTEVAVVPPVTAPVVPVAALTTETDGTTTVQRVAGGTVDDQPVTVLAVSDGLAAVEGVTVGDRVRVFGEPGSPQRPPGQGDAPAPAPDDSSATTGGP